MLFEEPMLESTVATCVVESVAQMALDWLVVRVMCANVPLLLLYCSLCV